MNHRKATIFIGLFLLAGALAVGFHFYAASSAEEQIDRTLQEQADAHSFSLQYSSVDLAPFSGTVTLNDVTLVIGTHIERAGRFSLEMGYLDFLNIYAMGLSYGLQRLENIHLTVIKPSYLNRNGLKEVKADTLKVSFRGNALDALRSAVLDTAFARDQHIEATGSGLTATLPGTPLTRLEAHRFRYEGFTDKGTTGFWPAGEHRLRLDSLGWTPSKALQTRYRFFIEGFGYPADRIPFHYATIQTRPASQSPLLAFEATVKSDLFLLTGSGRVRMQEKLAQSTFSDAELSAREFSPSFSRALKNIEELFAISIPRENNRILLQMEGTLGNPSVSQ